MATTQLSHSAGVSLKPEYFEEALASDVQGLWFEVHSENYFIAGGPRMNALAAVAEQFPLSFHGVGASLGGPDPLDPDHLRQVKVLVDRFNPALVSEHAVWSRFAGTYYADLLPLPRTQEAMQRLVDNIDAYQNAIGRRILVENPTNYLSIVSEMDEPDFLVEVAQRSGCGLLLDVNNLFLSAQNTGMDATGYLEELPSELVGEIHLAGYEADTQHEGLLIDSHSMPVDQSVWSLYESALNILGPIPTLIERDANLPPFAELVAESQQAQFLLDQYKQTDSAELAMEARV